MSETEIVILSDLITLVLSLTMITFAVGRTFGEVRRDISQMKHDLAQIQGMFVIRIRGDRVDKGD